MVEKKLEPGLSRQRRRGRLDDGSSNPVDVYIGGRMKQLRMLHGMSQEKLSKLMNLTFQQIQKYETGTNRLSGSRIYDLCQIYNVDANFFYIGIDEKIDSLSPRKVARNEEEAVEVVFGANKEPDPCIFEEKVPYGYLLKSENLELLINYNKLRQRNRELASALLSFARGICKIYYLPAKDDE